MPPNSEIEKLERRWKDNPKGTGFAPYAEALRKQGELELAREVLRQGLETHPDHIPGNIVLGRCCLDLVEDGPAEAAFRHVLDLDVENVIALKALAEITERQGRLAETVEWLSRLVASDPNNDEAVSHLARVEASRVAAAAAGSLPLTPSGAHAVPPMPVAESAAPIPVKAPLPPPAAGRAVEPAAPPPRPAPEPVAAAEPEPVAAAEPEPVAAAEPEPVAPPEAEPEPVAATEKVAVPVLPPPPPPPTALIAEADTVEIEPLERKPEPAVEVPGLLLSEIDRTGLSSDVIVDGIQLEEPPELSPDEKRGLERVEGLTGSGTYVVGVEKDTGVELSPGPANEFQAPDDSSALMGLASAGSEFQATDASLDLSPLPGGGSGYQTPDITAELAESWSDRQGAAPPRDSDAVPSFTIGAASLVLPPEPGSIPPEGLTATASDLDSPAGSPTISEVEAVPAVEETPPSEAPESKGSELHLIFPDQAAQPEPQKVRRISQEVPAIVIPASPAAEPVVGEPEPVMTESMAELYARQGHVADALRVYRALAAQQPGESKFRDRIRDLEAAQAPRPRKAGVAAVETGGESVESFFRSLSAARPGLMGLAAAAAERGQPSGKGAPTRPASDSLSLSAIFGEEPARTQAPPPPEPPAPQATDAFSFDQFFGKPAPESSRPSAESGRPSDEDLDQFQNWLKGLKR
ncbi:MAG: hypothetical protein OEV95_08490 [Gemmatimonadota bacterium]|nr:hypothetical protein [Gemmatimonadota bacterium]